MFSSSTAGTCPERCWKSCQPTGMQLPWIWEILSPCPGGQRNPPGLLQTVSGLAAARVKGVEHTEKNKSNLQPCCSFFNLPHLPGKSDLAAQVPETGTMCTFCLFTNYPLGDADRGIKEGQGEKNRRGERQEGVVWNKEPESQFSSLAPTPLPPCV